MSRGMKRKRPVQERPQRSKTLGNRGGRPLGVADDLLFQQRDGFIDLFTRTWGSVGWALRTASTRAHVVSAFASIGFPSYLSYLTAPFTRATAVSATAQDLRNLKRVISAERDEELAREIVLRRIGARVFETLHALKQGVSEDNKGTVVAQHRARLEAYAPLRAEDEERGESLRVRENSLLDAEASFSQDQLLEFLESKYAVNPRNLGCAVAGLPQIGWEQSFRRCTAGKAVSPPSRLYRAFSIIEACSNESPRDFLGALETAILELPKKSPLDADFRRWLCESWRYLRKAAEETTLGDDPAERRPYLTFDAFMRHISISRSQEDSLMASIEELDPVRAPSI